MAVLMALVMLLGCLTGCAQQEMPAVFGGAKAAEATEVTEETTEATADANADVTAEAVTEENTEETTEATADVTEEATEEVAEETTEEGYFVPFVEVIDGVVYCDVEYFLKRATVTFTDNTAALQAVSEGTEVILDDVHAVSNRGQHRDNTMMLPIKGGNVAVTFDGKVVTAAALHSHKGEWALCRAEGLETGYELVEKPKDKTEGEWLQITAVCVENTEADFGYDFYILVNEECVPEVVYNPVYTPQQPKPEVEEPELEVEDPTEEPEKDPVRGQKPDDEDEDEPAHNPEHNEPEVDEGEDTTGDGVYDPEDQETIPDLTQDPTEGKNDTVTDNGVEPGQEKIPDLTSNPTEGRNDINTRVETSGEGIVSTTTTTVTITNGNGNGNSGVVTPGHGSQVFD